MNYYSQWQELISESINPAAEETIQQYYELEKAAYIKILESGSSELRGRFAELASLLGFDDQKVIFTGFLDGINTSLANGIDLEALTDDTILNLEIDFHTLFIKMQEAKADWLYSLKEWNNIITPEKQQELIREYRSSRIVRRDKTGRNDPCPCESGKKFKSCCGKGA